MERASPQAVASADRGGAGAGIVGPVLVVADSATITALAPAWAEAFAAAGIVHRVAVHGIDVAAAAGDLGARTVVAAGSTEAFAAARAAAAALGVPFIERVAWWRNLGDP